MESCRTQAVLPLVGLAADQVIRDRDRSMESLFSGLTSHPNAADRPP
ncbi:MAG: hypothetical protein ACQESR_06785 [Planctomycetota bacterium]